MRYLVTGGAGFIGSHLVDALLAGGHEVRVLDNLSTGRREKLAEDAEFVHGDVTDADALSDSLQDIDGVFHLAAIASIEQANAHWFATHQVNAGAAVVLFEHCASRKIPVVYASSAAVYGNTVPPLTERSATHPINSYGADKRACELHAEAGALVHGLKSVGLRFFNVYGPRQDAASAYSSVISIFVQRLQEGNRVKLHGDGNQTRDFIFVEDAAAAALIAMQALESGKLHCAVLNVCTGNAVSIQQLLETLARLTGAAVQVDHQPPRPGDIKHSRGDNSALASLGFTPRTSLEEGLRQLLEHQS